MPAAIPQEKVDAFAAGIRDGLTVAKAAAAAGISRRSGYNLMKQLPPEMTIPEGPVRPPAPTQAQELQASRILDGRSLRHAKYESLTELALDRARAAIENEEPGHLALVTKILGTDMEQMQADPPETAPTGTDRRLGISWYSQKPGTRRLPLRVKDDQVHLPDWSAALARPAAVKSCPSDDPQTPTAILACLLILRARGDLPEYRNEPTTLAAAGAKYQRTAVQGWMRALGLQQEFTGEPDGYTSTETGSRIIFAEAWSVQLHEQAADLDALWIAEAHLTSGRYTQALTKPGAELWLTWQPGDPNSFPQRLKKSGVVTARPPG